MFYLYHKEFTIGINTNILELETHEKYIEIALSADTISKNSAAGSESMPKEPQPVAHRYLKSSTDATKLVDTHCASRDRRRLCIRSRLWGVT